jgi:hypothetical protein
MPSQLLLPVVPDVAVPAGLPACPGLRGEPCRDDPAPAAGPPAGDPAPGSDPADTVTGVAQGLGDTVGQVVQTLPGAPLGG